MLTTFIVLAVVTFLFWIGFKITGALLKGLFWLVVCLPATLIIWVIAIVCCCTLILIPIGLKLFKLGGKILIPG